MNNSKENTKAMLRGAAWTLNGQVTSIDLESYNTYTSHGLSQSIPKPLRGELERIQLTFSANVDEGTVKEIYEDMSEQRTDCRYLLIKYWE